MKKGNFPQLGGFAYSGERDRHGPQVQGSILDSIRIGALSDEKAGMNEGCRGWHGAASEPRALFVSY